MDLTVRFLSDRADLSASAAFALNRVCREGPIRLTTLAAKEGVSQPSMTQLIQRLERLGLVTRLADPDDGRAALIGITGARSGAARRPEASAPGTPDGAVGDAYLRGGIRVVALCPGRISGPAVGLSRMPTARPRRSSHDQSISGRCSGEGYSGGSRG